MNVDNLATMNDPKMLSKAGRSPNWTSDGLLDPSLAYKSNCGPFIETSTFSGGSQSDDHQESESSYQGKYTVKIILFLLSKIVLFKFIC